MRAIAVAIAAVLTLGLGCSAADAKPKGERVKAKPSKQWTEVIKCDTASDPARPWVVVSTNCVTIRQRVR